MKDPVHVEGSVIKIEEMRKVGKDNQSVLNFLVVEEYREKVGENEWNVKATKFYNCTAWRSRAEALEKTLVPGMKVYFSLSRDLEPKKDKNGDVILDSNDRPETVYERYTVLNGGPDIMWDAMQYSDEEKRTKAEESLEKMLKKRGDSGSSSRSSSSSSTSSSKKTTSAKKSEPVDDIDDFDDDEFSDF